MGDGAAAPVGPVVALLGAVGAEDGSVASGGAGAVGPVGPVLVAAGARSSPARSSAPHPARAATKSTSSVLTQIT